MQMRATGNCALFRALDARLPAGGLATQRPIFKARSRPHNNI
ncbi:hypothetical protein Z950_124 [Sulfitobacter mediterraneus KCTC 32188]|nr:hypothetical protein Z950_124 [Sulfitobacter mediterraneus KCTC 32188]